MWRLASSLGAGQPVLGLYRNRCDSCKVSLFEQGMTVRGAGADGEGSKVAQYGSTEAEAATKIGSLRLTSIGPLVLLAALVELSGTRKTWVRMLVDAFRMNIELASVALAERTRDAIRCAVVELKTGLVTSM